MGRCQAKITSGGNQGERCGRYASKGSRFCWVHDPERRDEMLAHTEHILRRRHRKKR